MVVLSHGIYHYLISISAIKKYLIYEMQAKHESILSIDAKT
jgi:hypothetical protein